MSRSESASQGECLRAKQRACAALRGRRLAAALALTASAGLGLGCDQNMKNGAREKPLEESVFFADGSLARQPPPGTVPLADARLDPLLWSGAPAGGSFVDEAPMPVDRALLRRGRERYAIFCSPCHGLVGDGRGMVVLRGYKQPPSFHSDRLRQQALGYFVDVIANGFGVMPSYAARVPPGDRWAMAVYLRALQLSQSAPASELSPADLQKVEASQ